MKHILLKLLQLMITHAASNFKTVLLPLKFNYVFENNYFVLGLILFSFLPHSLLCRHIYCLFRSVPFFSLASRVLFSEKFACSVHNYALSLILSSFFLLFCLILCLFSFLCLCSPTYILQVYRILCTDRTHTHTHTHTRQDFSA